MKNLFFWWLLFQMKKLLTFGIFNESNIWAKIYYIKKYKGSRVNYCWNYGQSKLLLHFIEYRLDHLNSKYTKIAVNSAIHYFEGCCQKDCLLRVRSSLVNPPQNLVPSTILAIKGRVLCNFANKILRVVILWDIVARIFSYY